MQDNFQENETNLGDDAMEKTFLKMKINMEKNGYRDGIEEGRQKLFQKYFDQGYSDGFKNGQTLGKIKGEICAKLQFDKMRGDKPTVPEKTSTGACIMCTDETLLSKSLEEIRKIQVDAVNKITQDVEVVDKT